MKADTKSTPNFGEASRRFRDAGINPQFLLPIAPINAMISAKGLLEEKSLGKAPGRYNPKTQDWTGLGGTATRDGLSSGDIKAVALWPTPNVGICGAYLPAIDCDAASPEFRRLVEDALDEAFGPRARYATRTRGENDRRLWAFRGPNLDSEDRIKTTFLKVRMPGDDPEEKPHGLDIIGFGNQYVAAGIHPSGDLYGWDPDWDITTLFESGELEKASNASFQRFLEIVAEKVEEAGGKVVRGSAGGTDIEERDHSSEPPVMLVGAILDGLDRLPNSDRDRFPFRDDFVQAVAAIRAALGSEAEAHEDDIREWACQDEDWCPPEYFDKVWNSLSRGQRVSRHALDIMFKQDRIYASAKSDFPDDLDEVMREIRSDIAKRKGENASLLAECARRYVIQEINTRTGDTEAQMRLKANVSVQWPVLKWWQKKIADNPGMQIIEKLREKYKPGEEGCYDFIRDLKKAHQHIFFFGETRHPNAERGDIVEEPNPDGTATRYINMRYVSPVIRYASKSPENKRQARDDVNFLLGFMGRMFLEKRLLEYELDTLAYMVQSGRRPGHLLFMVGAQGVGKSIYAHMLISMFDGIGKDMGGQIDGTKLTSEASRRFALARVEGCRIISVKELPDGKASTPANMAAITSALKQIVDPGPDADYFQIERKGVDSYTVQNLARVIITSNYNNAVKIEEQDRRIYYVSCGITLQEKPGPEFYVRLTDITGNPERLAAFWRYLRDRDVSHYNVALPPPVSAEKKAAQIAAIENPAERHGMAAMEALRHAGRTVFDVAELYDVMTAMADNEYTNSNGAVDDRKDYNRQKSRGPGADVQAFLRRLSSVARKVAEPKSGSVRRSAIYVCSKDEDLILKLASAKVPEVIAKLERDRERYPLSRTHPLLIYSGSQRPNVDRER